MRQTDQNLRPFRFALFVLFAGLMTATIILLTRFSLQVWMQAAGNSDTREAGEKLLRFNLGDQAYAVPANMLVQALPETEERQKGRLDIVVHWPTLKGKNEENRHFFQDSSRDAPLIHLMLRLHTDPISPSQRFERILSPSIAGAPIQAPPGLSGFRLSEGSGYGGENLFFDNRPDDKRFVIRCSHEDSVAAPAECLRSVQFTPEITLEYRYRAELLAHWRKIDTAILDLAESLKTSN